MAPRSPRLVIVCALVSTIGLARAAPPGARPVELDAGLAHGAWPDAVSLELPPAPRGTQPTLELVASHGTVDGPVGAGWHLAAVSAITRHSANGGVPNHTSTDRYRLDGQDLIGGQPETWDGSRFTYETATNTWSRRRDGWTYTYGSKAGTGALATKLLGDAGQPVPLPGGGTCVAALCKTSTWYLSKTVDPFGNAVLYHYVVAPIPTSLAARYPFATSRQHLPSLITYGATNQLRVELSYQPRPDPQLSAADGRPTLIVNRLKEVRTTVAAGAVTTTFSRYVLQYEDETAAGALLAPLTDCDGQPVSAAPAPTRSLLRKIVRVGTGAGAAPTPQHTLRCLTAHHQPTTWADDAAARPLAVIAPPTNGDDASYESAVPIAINLDHDGITDLLVLGLTTVGAGYLVDLKAYVATPDQPQAFAPASATGEAGAMALAWETMLTARLTDAFLTSGRGWALADLDDDHRPELLWEDAAGDVKIDRVLGPGLGSATWSTFLAGCDLRHGDLVDVDGDRRPDLIVRPHAQDGACAAQAVTRWIRNHGTAYFASSSATTLAAPLEAATPPAEWAALLAPTGPCAAGVSWPTDVKPTWNRAAYLADNTRYADFNGDGLLDLGIAAHACWTLVAGDDPIVTPDVNETDWAPVAGSTYSRIWWGDGYGRFIDSGLSAGPPLTYDLDSAGASNVVTGRVLTGLLTPIDLDRDGNLELLTTTVNTEGTGARWSSFRGLIAGWGAHPDVNLNGGAQPAGLGYLSPGASCYRRSTSQALGDFDGDGFVDILTLELDQTGDSPTCGGGDWCALLRPNQRTATEGRMIASDGAWGGRTQLTWGFTASPPHDNPNLATNLEVIERIDGGDGPVTLTYAGAFTSGGAPTAFAEVVRRNARDGVDQLGFITAPWAAGQPSYTARYRSNGSLEFASVFIYGRIDAAGYRVRVGTPYFNPLFRRCDYDVGHLASTGTQSHTLSSLLSRCYAFVGVPPGDGGEGWSVVELPDLPVALGQTDGALTPDGAEEHAASFGAEALSYGAVSTAVAWAYQPTPTATVAPAGLLRWPVPPELAAALPPIAAAHTSYVYPTDPLPTPLVETVDEWHWNAPLYRLDGRVEYGDTATAVDDRVHAFTWQQPDPTGPWYRETLQVVTARAGGQLARISHGDFVASYTPRVETRCGSDGVTCQSDRITLDARGDHLTHTFPGGGVESWTRDGSGLELTHRDPLGRSRTTTRDGAGRPRTVTFGGATTTWDRDGLGRAIRTTIAPGGGPTTTSDTYYDDSFVAREDSSFVEPRQGDLRGDGRLTLTYLDGFGRRTRQVECEAGGSTAGQTGVLARAACKPNTERTLTLELYGQDGLRKVVAEPFLPGETPTTYGFGHDGAGQIIVSYAPADAPGAAAWQPTLHRRGAGWSELEDPLHRRTRTERSTQKRQVLIGGVRRALETYDVSGRPVTRAGADGLVLSLTYDPLGRLLTTGPGATTSCLQGGALATCTWRRTVLARDGAGRITREREPDGVERSYTYDLLGRLLTVTVAGERIETYTWRDATTSAPAELEIVDQAGATRVERRDGLGRLIEVETEGVSESVAWGANGKPATAIDRNGRATHYRYDRRDQLVALDRPGGVTTRFTYDGGARVRTTIDADGASLSHSYTYSGRPWQRVRGGTWLEHDLRYDAAGQIEERLTDGVRTRFGYDALGRVETIWSGLDGQGVAELTTTLLRDAGDRVLRRTQTPRVGAAAATSYTYDGWGRLVAITDPLPATWILERDVVGRIRTSTDPRGVRRELSYDARGREVARQVAGGRHYTAYHPGQSYAGIDHLWRVDRWDDADLAQPTSVVTHTYVDALGREIAAVGRDGVTRRTAWSGDEVTTVTWHDAGGAALSMRDLEYDDAGRLREVIGPYAPGDAPATHDTLAYAYTAAGRVASIASPEQTTEFTYRHGLRETEVWADQVRTWHRLQADATWPTRIEHAGAGQVRGTDLVRDALGRLVSATTTAPGQPTVSARRAGFGAVGGPTVEERLVGGAVEVSAAWTYDPAGRPLTRTLAVAGEAPAVTRWSWNANGTLAELTTPSGARRGFDYGAGAARDLLIDRIYDPSGIHGDFAVVTARNGRGQITDLELPADGTSRHLSYDVSGRLVARTSGSAATPLSWAGIYDQLGRLIREDHTSGAEAWTNTYAYDGRGRLIDEARGRSGEHRRYHWSRGGNLLSTELDVGAGFATIMSAEYTGERLDRVDGVALSYDPWRAVLADQHGNQLSYDADGETRSVRGPAGPTVTLLRDAAGLPVAVHEGAATPRLYSWGLEPAGLPLEVRAAGGGPRTYVSGFGMLLEVHDGGGVTGAELDLQASLLRHGDELLDDVTGFGAAASPPAGVDERFLFAGLETIPGAPTLHLARHRTYDPETARFQSEDPTGLAGGRHRFAYADSDPIGLVDPMGLAPACLPVPGAPAPAGGGVPVRSYDFEDSGISTESVFEQVQGVLGDLAIHDLGGSLTSTSVGGEGCAGSVVACDPGPDEGGPVALGPAGLRSSEGDGGSAAGEARPRESRRERRERREREARQARDEAIAQKILDDCIAYFGGCGLGGERGEDDLIDGTAPGGPLTAPGGAPASDAGPPDAGANGVSAIDPVGTGGGDRAPGGLGPTTTAGVDEVAPPADGGGPIGPATPPPRDAEEPAGSGGLLYDLHQALPGTLAREGLLNAATQRTEALVEDLRGAPQQLADTAQAFLAQAQRDPLATAAAVGTSLVEELTIGNARDLVEGLGQWGTGVFGIVSADLDLMRADDLDEATAAADRLLGAMGDALAGELTALSPIAELAGGGAAAAALFAVSDGSKKTIRLSNFADDVAGLGAKLDEYEPGSGFSLVVDLSSGTWIALPTVRNARLRSTGAPPRGAAPDKQSHVEVYRELVELAGGPRPGEGLSGGALILQSDGSLKATFHSNLLGDIPESVRGYVMDMVSEDTGRLVWSDD
jgi:RHS repeat-associated protein